MRVLAILTSDHCILDFAVTNRYLVTTSTDFKLRIYDHLTGRLEYSGYIEGRIRVSRRSGHVDMSVREPRVWNRHIEHRQTRNRLHLLGAGHDEHNRGLQVRFQVQDSVSLGDDRWPCILCGRLAKFTLDQRITDLKFWKRMRSYKEYQFQYPTVYLSIAVNKKLYILNIPSKRKNNVKDNSQRILQITEIVIGGSISIATTNREDKTVLSQQSDDRKD